MKRWLLLGPRRLYLLDEPVTEKGHRIVDLDVPMRIKKLKKKQVVLLAGNNTFYMSAEELAKTEAFETDRDVKWAIAFRGVPAPTVTAEGEDDVIDLEDL